MYLKQLRSAHSQLSEKEINDIAMITRINLYKQGPIECTTLFKHYE
ncbi:hypothetical protein [Virgibacillus sp. DJP39]